MNVEQTKIVAGLSWRIGIMVLCCAAIACTGWYVAYERVFEEAFSTPYGWVIGCMAVSGFISWLYLAADTFIWMQKDVRRLLRKLHSAQKREQWNRVIAARRERLRILADSDPTPGNARKTIEALGRVKG